MTQLKSRTMVSLLSLSKLRHFNLFGKIVFLLFLLHHFSGYIVTAECINCCGQSANAHVFGSLTNDPGSKPLATVKIYLSSSHGDIEDYQSNLQRRENGCKNPLFLLQNKEIHLSTEEYDASKSKIKLTLEPGDEKVWKSYKNKPMSVAKPLNEALKYKKGHICKMNPTEVDVFYLESLDQFKKHLRVDLDIGITIAKTVKKSTCTLQTEKSNLLVLNIHDTSGVDYAVKELTDSHVLKLSRSLSEREDIRKLAVTGLNMDSCEVDIAFQNNQKAVNSLLSQWCNSHKDSKTAYIKLCRALQKVGMQRLINELE